MKKKNEKIYIIYFESAKRVKIIINQNIFINGIKKS